MVAPVGSAAAAVLPDYRVIAVSNPPATGGPGTSFGIFDTTKNFGEPAEDTTATNLYISANGTRDGDDILLAGRGMVGLGDHEKNSGGVNAHLPDPIAKGTYYVFACADGTGALAESREDNNCHRSATKIAISNPDYQVTNVTDPPANGAPGTIFGVFDTTKNFGGPTDITSVTNLYLSRDEHFDGSDLLMAGRGLLGLAKGAENTGGVNAHVPDEIADGRYYVIACADAASNLIAESNEGNNCRRSANKMRITNPV
jgi:subtilase family serine protease